MRHAGCNSVETIVVDSRWRNGRVWRRRKCLKCGAKLATFEVTDKEFTFLKGAEKMQSELEERQWAVIDSTGVRATDLTYAEADELKEKLLALHDSGMTIVTAKVAARITDNGL